MRRINDTYSYFWDSKIHIGKNTVIHTDNKIIEGILDGLREDLCGVKDIYFRPFDAEAFKSARKLFPTCEEAHEDSYFITFDTDAITVYSSAFRADLYGASRIANGYSSGIACGAVYNTPLVPFRAIKTYVPGRDQINFYKSFIDMCLSYGYNAIVMEVGGAMEYKRHPEINEGWEEYTEIFCEYIGKSFKAQRCMPHNKDSIHWENGGGSYLRQDELCDIIKYARARGIDVIPEVPSLSHSDYLLTRHPELAENPLDPIPDTYCPLRPGVYELLFDVIDEVIEVFRPKTMHIAHDEWYSACMCDECRGKDPAKLFYDDVKKIYDYIKAQNIEVMMWADMPVRCTDKNGNVRGSGVTVAKRPTAETVEIRGRIFNVNKEIWCRAGEEIARTGGTYVFHAPRTDSCIDILPKDIVMMNWMHHYDEDLDLEYIRRGMTTVYGNFYPRSFKNWFYCIGRGVDGICISNWSMLDRDHMQRMAIFFNMAYASMMLWQRDFDENKVKENTLAAASDLFRYQRSLDKAPHTATVIHGSLVKVPHEIFWDGVTIDYDKDKMGDYRIVYKDGTEELLPIYYGCNIGVIFPIDYDDGDDPNGTKSHILEPTFTCDYEIIGNEVYYKLVISSERKIEKIIPEIFKEYEDTVIIKKAEINQ